MGQRVRADLPVNPATCFVASKGLSADHIRCKSRCTKDLWGQLAGVAPQFLACLRYNDITRTMVVKKCGISLAEAARGFAAVGSEPRLAVLRTLVRAGDEGLSVGEIQERVGQPASTLAHHLRTLAAGGLITQDKRGRAVISHAAYEHIQLLASYLVDECCADTKRRHPGYGHPGQGHPKGHPKGQHR